ncbi:MAG: DUF4331 family protein [Gemmatimonadota bacterium]|nr:DUF4331 family protein [Gemmatimonadota bacterium]
MKPIHRTIRSLSLALVPLLAVALVACDDDDDGGVVGPSPSETFTQQDRFGLPGINTVFIPSGTKQQYNRSIPSNDPANYRDEVIATLGAFGITGDAASGIADFVLPDVQPVDLSQATAFPNGRKPSDDVITAELMLIFGDNEALNDDHVDGNDKAFLQTFPYLAAPH